MPYVEPFRGVYYNCERAGSINTVIAPPYDKVDAATKRELHARSPYNAVRLELPETDNEPDWCRRVAKSMSEWIGIGILDRHEEPTYYVYEHEFEFEATKHHRWGFLGVLHVGTGDSAVKPHEKTFAHIKQERLELMRAARANLSPIFVIYSDPANTVRDAFTRGQQRPLFAATDDDGTLHRVSSVNDLPVLAAAQRTLKEAPMLIADGHHRFETAQAYAAEMRKAHPTDPPGMPYNFVMAYFTPAEDDGLVILPAHRVMTYPAGKSDDDLDALIADNFDSQEVADAQAAAEAVDNGKAQLAVVTRKRSSLLTAKPGKLEAAVEPETSEAKRSLPVVALHALLVDPLLDGAPLKEQCKFLRDTKRAASMVGDEGDAAFLWPAVTPPQVMDIAQQGERMPQKSTDFYPKVATGLIFNVFY